MEGRIRSIYSEVPAAIAAFAALARAQACRVGYDKPVCLPYDMRKVFVRIDPPDQELPPRPRRFRTRVKSFALNWVLPPQIASIVFSNTAVWRRVFR